MDFAQFYIGHSESFGHVELLIEPTNQFISKNLHILFIHAIHRCMRDA